MPQRRTVAREPRGAVRQIARVLLFADRYADVRLAAAAVDAFAALGAEQGDHVVAGFHRGDILADRLDHAGTLVAEHARQVPGRVGARGRVKVGVTDAARVQAHEHLAAPRFTEFDLLHYQRRRELLQHRRANPHGREPRRSAQVLAICGRHRGVGRAQPVASIGAMEENSLDTVRMHLGTPYRVSLPDSSGGPTTCTVYESDYATQIVVDSTSLNVRAECELWAANQPGVGYLWGYERAGVTPDVVRLCRLSDPKGKMTATVIEDTGFVPLSDTQRANGGSACAAIRASGWTRERRRTIPPVR